MAEATYDFETLCAKLNEYRSTIEGRGYAFPLQSIVSMQDILNFILQRQNEFQSSAMNYVDCARQSYRLLDFMNRFGSRSIDNEYETVFISCCEWIVKIESKFSAQSASIAALSPPSRFDVGKNWVIDLFQLIPAPGELMQQCNAFRFYIYEKYLPTRLVADEVIASYEKCATYLKSIDELSSDLKTRMDSLRERLGDYERYFSNLEAAPIDRIFDERVGKHGWAAIAWLFLYIISLFGLAGYLYWAFQHAESFFSKPTTPSAYNVLSIMAIKALGFSCISALALFASRNYRARMHLKNAYLFRSKLIRAIVLMANNNLADEQVKNSLLAEVFRAIAVDPSSGYLNGSDGDGSLNINAHLSEYLKR